MPNARSHPVEGGSANNYDYCNGDPVNCWDLGGTKPVRPLNSTEEARLAQLLSNCSGPDAAGADIDPEISAPAASGPEQLDSNWASLASFCRI